jgi:hypothetical protein
MVPKLYKLGDQPIITCMLTPNIDMSTEQFTLICLALAIAITCNIICSTKSLPIVREANSVDI